INALAAPLRRSRGAIAGGADERHGHAEPSVGLGPQHSPLFCYVPSLPGRIRSRLELKWSRKLLEDPDDCTSKSRHWLSPAGILRTRFQPGLRSDRSL